MGVFARINEQGLVDQVISIPDEFDVDGDNYIDNVLRIPGVWKHSHTDDFVARGSMAYIGGTYLEDVDKFMPPKPSEYQSFIFDTDNWKWVAPVAEPQDAFWLANIESPPVPFDIEESEDGTFLKITPPVIEEDKKVYLWDEANVDWVRTSVFEPPKPQVLNIDSDNPLSPESLIKNQQEDVSPTVPRPDDGKVYAWEVTSKKWVEADPSKLPPLPATPQ